MFAPALKADIENPVEKLEKCESDGFAHRHMKLSGIRGLCDFLYCFFNHIIQ